MGHAANQKLQDVMVVTGKFIQFYTCQISTFYNTFCTWWRWYIWTVGTRPSVQRNTCQYGHVFQNIWGAWTVWIFSLTWEILYSVTRSKVGHLLNELLYSMARANMETCEMNICALNRCVMCQYLHVVYEVSYSLSALNLYTCHGSFSATSDAYMGIRMACHFVKSFSRVENPDRP